MDATVLTGAFGGGGHARAAGATLAMPASDAGPTRSSPRRRGSWPRVRRSTMAHNSLGPGLDGILVVAKPGGPTSHDVVALVRRLAATKRVGHGGTLDPFASGVLPVFLGHGTRVVEYHSGDRKGYRATVCFGASSSTDDLEGELVPSSGPAPTATPWRRRSPAFVGAISQRPPAFSAIKVGGRRAYAMARAGETVVLAEREVTIHELTMLEWDGSDPERPIAILDVVCSAGTYIRALARDLGETLGSAAYLGALGADGLGAVRAGGRGRRSTRSAAAAAGGPEGLLPLLKPIDTGLEAFPEVVADRCGDPRRRPRPVRLDRRPGFPVMRTTTGCAARTGRSSRSRRSSGGRLAPDKVFVVPGARRGRRALTPAMRVVNGVDALPREAGPVFVVVGVFDGLHLGPSRTCSSTWSPRPGGAAPPRP